MRICLICIHPKIVFTGFPCNMSEVWGIKTLILISKTKNTDTVMRGITPRHFIRDMENSIYAIWFWRKKSILSNVMSTKLLLLFLIKSIFSSNDSCLKLSLPYLGWNVSGWFHACKKVSRDVEKCREKLPIYQMKIFGEEELIAFFYIYKQ